MLKNLNKKNGELYRGTAFFISSSSNTWDVFSLVSPSFFEAVRDCNLPIYVGTNEIAPLQGATLVTYSARSGWRNELINQIAQLPEAVVRIILVLDDFYFFNSFSESALFAAIDQHESDDMDYLRCEPPRRSVIGQVIQSYKHRNSLCIRLKQNEPYYSSLQVAIWSREYLISLLSIPGNIWEFEWRVIDGSAHYAVKQSLFEYQHLVEKGKWLPHSKSILGKNFDFNKMQKRGFHSSSILKTHFVVNLKFKIFGYSFLIIKNYFSYVKSRIRSYQFWRNLY